jgi:hypothetical protein
LKQKDNCIEVNSTSFKAFQVIIVSAEGEGDSMRLRSRLRISIFASIVLLFISVALATQAKSSNLSPVASFSYSPTTPAPNEIIAFNASASYDPDGSIVNYAWNFGDGNVTIMGSPIITHTYPMDGNYTVELAVTDNTGLIGVACAVIQVRTVVFFRVVMGSGLYPFPKVEVTMYYKTGSTWVKAPVGPNGLEIKYDNMTQPYLAYTAAQKYRNPGYTASILLHDASNIGFDVHPSCWTVFFKFQFGSYVVYWPDNPSTVYSYNKGAVETHNYLPCHQAYWDPTISKYVIRVSDIPGHGVSPTECHPIIVRITIPSPVPNYYLTVKTDPADITTISGGGWYVNGTCVSLTAPTYVNVSSTTRYRFSYWDVDGVNKGSVNPISVNMNSNHTAKAHYITQYFLTVSSLYGSPSPVSGWFDCGSSIIASVSSPVGGPSGTQYVCTGWTGTGSAPGSGSGMSTSFSITQASSITWTWTTQYRVTFNQTGVGSDFTGTVVTIDSVNYGVGALPISFWWNSCSTHTVTYQSPLVVASNAKRYVWTSTTGLSTSQSGSLTVTKSGSVTGNYKTQYYLTVTSPYDSPTPTSGWFDCGSSIIASVSSPVGGPSGTQYVCTGWTGTGSAPGSGSGTSTSFSITQASSITWTWTTQYYLTVSSPYDSPTPTSGWFDSGTNVSASVSSPIAGSSGTQYACTGWSGTGSVVSGSGTSVTFSITQASSITWNWKTQYHVIFDQTGVEADFTGTIVTIDGTNYNRGSLSTQFWWDQDSSHSFFFASPLVVNGNKRYVWISTSGLSNLRNGTLTITASGNVVGNYIVQNCVTFDLVGVSSDFTGTVLIVDSTSYSLSALPVSFNWSLGSVHNFAFQSPLVVTENGKKYVWTSTTGLSTLQSGSLNVTAYGSIIGNYKTQYYLTMATSPSGVASPSGTGWYDAGTYATISTDQYAPGGSRYRFAGWTTADMSEITDPTSPSTTVLMDKTKTLTANYVHQYLVTFSQTGLASDASATVVTVNGTAIAYSGLSYSVWVDEGSVLNYLYATTVASTTAGKQFSLVSVTGPSSPITVTADITVTGNYKTQYQITFSQSGVGTDFTGTVVTIDGTDYTVGTLPTAVFWWDNNSGHTFSFASPLTVNASKSYVWVSTSGGLTNLQSGTLTVTNSGSVTGNYAVYTKCQVIFGQTGVNGDFTGTVVIIDGVNYKVTDLSASFWWDVGSVHTFAYQSPLVVTANGKQYVWTSTSGLSTAQNGSIKVLTSGSVIGNYKTQYYLTMATSPSGVASPSGTGWYDDGASATISTPAFVDIVPGSSRYRFNGWTTADMSEITDPTRSPTTVLMDKAKTVTSNYIVQYYVTFSQSGVGVDFTGTVVVVDAINYDVAHLQASFWWDVGSVHTFAYQSPLVVTANGKQYVWTSTTGLSTLQSDSITVSGSGSVTGKYKTQYYLAVSSPNGSPTPTSGWFDASSSVTASVTSPWSGSTGTRYICTGWTGAGSVPPSGTGSSLTFTITQSSSITWNWVAQYYLTVKTDPSGIVTIPGEGWYNASKSVSLSAPSVSGYPFLNWDVDGVSQGSGVSTINVNMNMPHTAIAYYAHPAPPSVPVGGYSISLVKQIPVSSMTMYAMLIVLFGLVLSLRKRKRK